MEKEILEKEKQEICKAISDMILALSNKYGLEPLKLNIGYSPYYSGGKAKWDGTVHLVLGC